MSKVRPAIRPDPEKIIVPRKHAQILIEPPLGELVEALGDRESGEGGEKMFDGEAIQDMRRRAREHFLVAAREWAERTGAEAPAASALDQPWVLTGHQVEFYHAGVWAKVIAVDELARRTKGAVGFDLLVDHDVVDHLGFDVPTQEGAGWKRSPIHWGRGSDLPADSLAAPTAEAFERWDTDLAFHLHAHTDTLAFMLAALRTGVGGSYVAWLSQARGKLERALGIDVHHVPTSLVCGGETWRRFVVGWMHNAAGWSGRYNFHLAAYRKRQGIKNVQHPMPDLGHRREAGGADIFELPFWIYRKGEARQRLFIRKGGDGGTTFLYDGVEHAVEADFAMQPEAGAAFEIRPRALTLTMYSRLFLADVFVHGIGGALYDQITDGILADLFGMEPPYACVSAAWLLPLGQPLEGIDDISHLKWLLHHTKHNPQQAIDAFTALKTEVAELIAARKTCVEQIAGSLAAGRKSREGRLERRDWFRELHAFNGRLHEQSPRILERLEGELAAALTAREENKVLLWREYFYGLHTMHSLAELIAKIRAM